MEMSIKATKAHTYQQEFAAQSAIGPATVYPHMNLLVPGQELWRAGISKVSLIIKLT